MNWSVHPGTKQRGKFNLCPKFVFLSDLADELISELPWSICRIGEGVWSSLTKPGPASPVRYEPSQRNEPLAQCWNTHIFLSVLSEQAEAKEMDNKLIIPLRAGEGNNRHLMVQPNENVADKRSSVNSKRQSNKYSNAGKNSDWRGWLFAHL